MITVGVDLAASPEGTALAMLRWKDGRARLEMVRAHLHDDQLSSFPPEVAKIGIDCPLGWPIAFRKFLDQQDTGVFERPLDRVRAREPLAYRVTDLRLMRYEKPLRPLSVSADRIAHVAFRCAALLPKLDPTLDRSGHGLVVETYPAGSLFVWGRRGKTLPYRGYKGQSTTARAKREQIVEALDGLVQFGFDRMKCIGSDHILDAVIAAVSARAAQLKLATLPSPQDMDVARAEGWIALPNGSLDDIAELAERFGP